MSSSFPSYYEFNRLFPVTMNSIVIKLTGNEDRHKISDEFKFAGNEDRHKSSNEFAFGPNRIIIPPHTKYAVIL